MSFSSSPDLLVLHAVRIKGMADVGTVARRFSLDRAEVEELLLDREAFGHVQRSAFAGTSGWSLTEAGRVANEQLLAAELAAAGVRDVVADAHAGFVPLNARMLAAVTRWQLRPRTGDPMAANDHTDWGWDEGVLGDLAGLAKRMRVLEEQLASGLARFEGYADRFDAALARVDRGERRMVDEPRIDSCHTVWFELHEDLLATLGLTRGAGA